jgi:hypothetical protein
LIILLDLNPIVLGLSAWYPNHIKEIIRLPDSQMNIIALKSLRQIGRQINIFTRNSRPSFKQRVITLYGYFHEHRARFLFGSNDAQAANRISCG